MTHKISIDEAKDKFKDFNVVELRKYADQNIGLGGMQYAHNPGMYFETMAAKELISEMNNKKNY